MTKSLIVAAIVAIPLGTSVLFMQFKGNEYALTAASAQGVARGNSGGNSNGSKNSAVPVITSSEEGAVNNTSSTGVHTDSSASEVIQEAAIETWKIKSAVRFRTLTADEKAQRGLK